MVLTPLAQSALLVLALLQGGVAPEGVAQRGRVQIPPPTGLVNDFAGVLSQDAMARMEQIAQDVRAKSRGEIAIVTLPSIGDEAASDVALRIGREWGVGKLGNPGDPTRNAGAVILLVPKETNADGRGRCFVATGRGAEGFITDAEAGSICREATPFFAQRNYGAGLLLVTYLAAQRFATEFNFTLDTALRAPQLPGGAAGEGEPGGFPPQLLFLAVVFAIILLSSLGRGRRGRGGCGGCLPIFIPWGGLGGGGHGGWSGGGGGWGGGGGGFGGFGGGGGFSGGGGGSSW